ncbi:MT-A70-domain-containing protein [Ramicandelaber brevisporus]|nr:MT-A70-domain-containing protein [Ramicandelaber brevisporus]
MLPSRLSHLGAHTSVADSRPFLEFCPHGTSTHCIATNNSTVQCWRLHFRPIIGPNTVLELGDCSYLNTCFRMDTCRYQHQHMKSDIASAFVFPRDEHLTPPQWINCDIRSFDFSVLGKFSVIMADPPWDIHMSLPYGTMTDDEMRNLPVAQLSDEGIIVLWITGRAMELGRECLRLWGYERVDELVWIKTNQTQRLIRTGRTGHWLNHSKEHCLIGMKGHKSTDTGQQQQQQQQKPHYQRLYDMINRALISDVIVGEVRETSRKPDQIYGLIDRLVPGRRKLEIFGRQHNTRPGWITLGNQLDGHCVYEPDLVERYNKAYPDSPIELSKTSDTNH